MNGEGLNQNDRACTLNALCKRNKSNGLFSMLAVSFLLIALSSCDFNILGGSNSKLAENYNPGLRTESLPPTISPVADLIMDEFDVQNIPFTISDPDTFLFCNNINVYAKSSKPEIIASQNLRVSGIYPNCNLQITAPGVVSTTTLVVTLQVYDFWTLVSTTFNLTIERVEKPGPFQITHHEGLLQSILANWSNAAYMSGTSGRYTIHFKKLSPADQNLYPGGFAGIIPPFTPTPFASATGLTSVGSVTSPYWITGPDYTLDPQSIYEVFVTAKNAYHVKFPNEPPTESNHVFVRTLERFRFAVREFVAASNQDFIGGACLGHGLSGQGGTCGNTGTYFSQGTLSSPMEKVSVFSQSGRYKAYLNAQGIMFGVDQ